jgi:gliding-associated putative ABC transporter substrate-binding component GldG
MTGNGMFTLSGASRALVGSLDDRLTVTAYFTEELPAPYNATRRTLLDQLNEYKAYAKGNLHFTFVDPSGPALEQEAEQNGISPVQVQVLKDDKFEVKRGYMGVVLQYEGRKEILPVVQHTATLEYELSSAIKRLSSTERRTIGFLTGHGEVALGEANALQEVLKKQYEVVTVDVSRNTRVPDRVAVLVVAGPTGRVPEDAKFQIDQFLMRGGRAIFLLNRIDANLQAQFGRPLETNLEDMLESYGVRVNADAVRDVQCASINVMQPQIGFPVRVPFPYIPVASTFSEGNMIVKDLQGIVMVFASSLDTIGLSSRGLRGEILVRSSKQSGRQSGMLVINPLQEFTAADFPESGIPLAAMVSGSFRSFYAGKPVPSDTAAGVTPPLAGAKTQSPETQILVVGDGDLIRDQYASRDNGTFLANGIDVLADDAGLVTIRSREASTPPLDPVEDGMKRWIKILNLALPPLLVVTYGLLRWRGRRARQKALELA